MTHEADAAVLGALQATLYAFNVLHGPHATRQLLGSILSSEKPLPSPDPAPMTPVYRGRWADIEDDN